MIIGFRRGQVWRASVCGIHRVLRVENLQDRALYEECNKVELIGILGAVVACSTVPGWRLWHGSLGCNPRLCRVPSL